MKTFIKTIHEEYFNDDNKSSISILINYNGNYTDILDDFIVYFDNGVYIFFETIFDCINFVTYDMKTIKRGYIYEDDFDDFYDEGIDGVIRDKLNWFNI